MKVTPKSPQLTKNLMRIFFKKNFSSVVSNSNSVLNLKSCLNDKQRRLLFTRSRRFPIFLKYYEQTDYNETHLLFHGTAMLG